MSLKGKMPGSHLHYLMDISCRDCHVGEEPFSSAGTERCLECHISGEEVARLTEKMDTNPHNSVHYGTELDCDLCHHMHESSENYCNQCHEFDSVVP